MALKGTVFKAEVQIADMDRGYYGSHALTLVRHPSETDERMMVRLLAFALHADERLEFGRGLSTDDEPDLWRKDLTGAIELWLDVGLPDERGLRKACARAQRVALLAYGGRAADVWWSQNRAKLERLENLSVTCVPASASIALTQLVTRSMALQFTLQDGHVWVSSDADSVLVEPVPLLAAAVS